MKKTVIILAAVFAIGLSPLVPDADAARTRLSRDDLDVSNLQGLVNWMLLNTLNGVIEIPGGSNPMCIDIADLLGLGTFCNSFSVCASLPGGQISLPPNQTFLTIWENGSGGDVLTFMLKTNRVNLGFDSSLDIDCLFGLLDIQVDLTQGDFESGPNRLAVRTEVYRDSEDGKLYLEWADSEAIFENVDIDLGVLPDEWEDWLLGWLNPGIAALMSMLMNSVVLQDGGPMFNIYDEVIRNYQPPPPSPCGVIPGSASGSHVAGMLLYLVPVAFVLGLRRKLRR